MPHNTQDPVTEFYKSYNEGDRDMTTLEHGRRGVPLILKIVILIILAACGVAAWFGYRAFNGEQIPFFQFVKKDAYMDVQVTQAEKEVLSNSVFSVRVFLKNTSTAPLDPVSVIIDYPEGFVFSHSAPILPKNEQKNYWEIGSLTSGEEITLTITGRVAASTGSGEKNLHTTVFYKPVQVSSEFKTEVDTLLAIRAPEFRLRIDGPIETEKGSEEDYQIVFHAQSLRASFAGAEAHPPFEVVFEHPKNFELKDMKPAPVKEGLRWDIAGLLSSLANDDLVSIALRGSFQTEFASSPLTAKIGYYLGDEFVILDQTQFLPSLALPFEKNLLISLTLDGKSSPLFLTPSEPDMHKGIPLTVFYENTGKIVLQNVSFTLHIPKNNILSSLPSEWSLPNSEPAFPYTYQDEQDNQIRMSPREIPALSEIGASATGTISFILRNTDYQSVRARISEGNSYEAPLAISLSADIEGPQKRSLTGPIMTITRNSDTSLRVNRSSEGTPIAIEWIVENSLHALENVRIRATLPESIAWTQNTSVSAGTIRYNPDTREALWIINRLPTGVKSISARFELEGELPQNDTVTTLTAKDNTTGALISIQKTF
ncbi:hypothetical protein HY621_03005 [Candidatus Uhrbacteria bacterium]|nr:hypothetical protein [Candidatus Uhrbacteria bacterium]